MKLTTLLALAGLFAAGAACAAGGDDAAKLGLDPGDAAPAFELPGSDGKTHSLADNVGKRAVIVAWFPKAFTGG
jgi:peroxiredoxin Q/BCP